MDLLNVKCLHQPVLTFLLIKETALHLPHARMYKADTDKKIALVQSNILNTRQFFNESHNSYSQQHIHEYFIIKRKTYEHKLFKKYLNLSHAHFFYI